MSIARPAGEFTIRRASHVEPTETGEWTADLTPVNGPILGPFATHQDAIDAEIRWLEEFELKCRHDPSAPNVREVMPKPADPPV